MLIKEVNGNSKYEIRNSKQKRCLIIMMDYNLQKRTIEFSKNSIIFAKKLPVNHISRPIITQYIKCSSSIGANYCEANNAESKADFRHKISISRKESQETCYWLEIMKTTFEEFTPEIIVLLKEATELNLILSKILLNSKDK
jgi:four helix bundle protein